MMLDSASLRDGQLRGSDVHAAVELHRIRVHDLGAGFEPLGDVECQVRLAGSGRTDDRQRSHG
jgi:hypothetical protein